MLSYTSQIALLCPIPSLSCQGIPTLIKPLRTRLSFKIYLVYHEICGAGSSNRRGHVDPFCFVTRLTSQEMDSYSGFYPFKSLEKKKSLCRSFWLVWLAPTHLLCTATVSPTSQSKATPSQNISTSQKGFGKDPERSQKTYILFLRGIVFILIKFILFYLFLSGICCRESCELTTGP